MMSVVMSHIVLSWCWVIWLKNHILFSSIDFGSKLDEHIMLTGLQTFDIAVCSPALEVKFYISCTYNINILDKYLS